MSETSVGEGIPSSKKPACKSGNNINVDIVRDETSVEESKVRRRSVKKPAGESGHNVNVDTLLDNLQSSSGIKGVNITVKVKECLPSCEDVETWSQDSVFVAIPGQEDGITVIDPDKREVGPEYVVETEPAHTDTNPDIDTEDSLESQPTGNPPTIMFNNWTEEASGGEQTAVRTTGNQASEPSSSYPTVGSWAFDACIEAVERIYKDCRNSFNKNDLL